MGPCSVDGCGRAVLVVKRGYCRAHYRRWLRYGDPLAGSTMLGDPLAFLTNLIGYGGDECIQWPFVRNKRGIGAVQFKGHKRNAARVMCILTHGDPPAPDMDAAHSCGKAHEGCVNPKHLRWATKVENQADRIRHGTTCRGTKNPQSKLTESDVIAIKNARGRVKPRLLAEQFGVTVFHIRKIHTGRIWRWLDASS